MRLTAKTCAKQGCKTITKSGNKYCLLHSGNCRFQGVDCSNQDLVLNDHGVPMCPPCTLRWQARNNKIHGLEWES